MSSIGGDPVPISMALVPFDFGFRPCSSGHPAYEDDAPLTSWDPEVHCRMASFPDLPSAEDVASLPPSDILDLIASLSTCHPGLYSVESLPTGSYVAKCVLYPGLHGAGSTANDSLWSLEAAIHKHLLTFLPESDS